ncbi:hypothetical protein C8F04DRAFT_1395327 [Mycena alexandri]|uniref:Uncharacterized protein n=1 Tax=Mycena alexandri TaxID=1745969 RepID=A0AAD6X307_9AGAR|nr:hypothetical protein C8F04DRAFT_1395327 [Mycena alexandri]
MMSKTLALFALLSATLVCSSVIRAPAPTRLTVGKGPGSDSIPSPVLFETCVDENLVNCVGWQAFAGTPIRDTPSGCTSLDDIINTGINLANDVSSVAVLNARIGCTLYTSSTCDGESLFINGTTTINALSAFNFDNIANSFLCLDQF